MLDRLNTDRLIAMIREKSAADEAAIARKDFETEHKLSAELRSIGDELLGRGDAGRKALRTLLAEPNDELRLLAAARLLPYESEVCVPVLEAISRDGSGGAAVFADMVLREWREGKLAAR